MIAPTVQIQLAKGDGTYHHDTNGVDKAFAETLVKENRARIVTEGMSDASAPVVDNRNKGVSFIEMESRMDTKIRALEAKLLNRMRTELAALEERITKKLSTGCSDDAAGLTATAAASGISEMSVKELRKLAAELNIEGQSSMKKDELLESIKQAQS